MINRRNFLRAAGVSLGLPYLESLAVAGASTTPPKRMLFVCSVLGLYPPAFFPRSPGKNYEPTEYLNLLKNHRQI